MTMKKSIAVLGLGKYGMSLVRSLYEMGMDVLAVDREEMIVKEIADGKERMKKDHAKDGDSSQFI